MLHVAAFTVTTAVSIIGLIGAVATGFVLIRKLGPERDALFISSAQGAAVIMDGLITTLRAEVDRCREANALLETQNQRLEAQNQRLAADNEALREEVEGLRAHKGRRRGEGDG